MGKKLHTALVIFFVFATIATQGFMGINEIEKGVGDGLEIEKSSSIILEIEKGSNMISEGEFALETCDARKDRIRDKWGGKAESNRCVNGFCLDGIVVNAAKYIQKLDPGPIVDGECIRGMCKGNPQSGEYEDNMWVIGQMYPRVFINHPEFWPSDMTEDPLGCYDPSVIPEVAPPVTKQGSQDVAVDTGATGPTALSPKNPASLPLADACRRPNSHGFRDRGSHDMRV